jgi:hypothetical protein
MAEWFRATIPGWRLLSESARPARETVLLVRVTESRCQPGSLRCRYPLAGR